MVIYRECKDSYIFNPLAAEKNVYVIAKRYVLTKKVLGHVEMRKDME